ncbi:hypothetical protein NL676_019179 [Syzygium grande]|nr:hypothetical protein NL676_019179 [Syzygium grande]
MKAEVEGVMAKDVAMTMAEAVVLVIKGEIGATDPMKLNDVFPQYTVLYKKWVEEVKFMGSDRKSQPNNIAHDNSGLLQDNDVLEIGQIRVPYKETRMSQMSPTTELENMCVHEQYEETQATNSCEPSVSDAVTSKEPRITSTHQMQTRLKSGILKPNSKYACLVEYRVPA